MTTPGRPAPSRQIVEPQSPLVQLARNTSDSSQSNIPEVGADDVAAVGLALVHLGRALGDLEVVTRVDGIGAVGRAAHLAAVEAVAERLGRTGQSVPRDVHEAADIPS